MAVTITIAATDRSANVVKATLSIVWPASGRSVARFTTWDRTGSDYRPAIGDAVTIADGATTVFAGMVAGLSHGKSFYYEGVKTDVECVDYGAYPGYRVLRDVTYTTGQSLKTVLQDLVTDYLAVWSVTNWGSMATGSTQPQLDFDGRTLSDVFDELCGKEGWIWEITSAKVFKAYAPGTEAGPANFNESDTHTREVRWTQRRDPGGYATRVIVRYGSGTDTTADAGGYASDPREIMYTYADVTDSTQAGNIASHRLSRLSQTGKDVTIRTLQSGYKPGQSVTVAFSSLGISSATYYIREVQARHRSVQDTVSDQFTYTVSMVESTSLPSDWRDYYGQLTGGYIGSASTGPILVGGGSGPLWYFLGGSTLVDVIDSTWTDVPDAVRVTLDSADFTGRTVTVRVRCKTRDAGTTVQPRLWNETDSSAVGTGSATASTTWEEQTFSVTLTTGTKRYVLQLLPSNTSAGVMAIGNLEA